MKLQFLRRSIYKLAMMDSLRFLCFLLNFRLVGAMFIFAELYSVFWVGKEAKQARITMEVEAATKYREKEDSETWIHLHANSEKSTLFAPRLMVAQVSKTFMLLPPCCNLHPFSEGQTLSQRGNFRVCFDFPMLLS